ncbi:hypothetical protein EAH81_17555 [Flavobacterium pectinovorum]|uniref:Uncharacterized protein n=1 Tax=Flavobacterium pectinovorum TaxID=29533 RepID=A0A502EJ65_9FLAO|nr:hypothetical protein EAH81_17555 [Flavobacterium pectinovorum]
MTSHANGICDFTIMKNYLHTHIYLILFFFSFQFFIFLYESLDVLSIFYFFIFYIISKHFTSNRFTIKSKRKKFIPFEIKKI